MPVAPQLAIWELPAAPDPFLAAIANPGRFIRSQRLMRDETRHTTLRGSSGTFPSHHNLGKPDIQSGPDRPHIWKVWRLNWPNRHVEDFRLYPTGIEVKSESPGPRQTDPAKSQSARARESRTARPITFSGIRKIFALGECKKTDSRLQGGGQRWGLWVSSQPVMTR